MLSLTLAHMHACILSCSVLFIHSTMYLWVHTVHVFPQGQVCTDLSSFLSDNHVQAPSASLLAAATESSAILEREVARLEQVNKDVKAACQGLQATVDDLSR